MANGNLLINLQTFSYFSRILLIHLIHIKKSQILTVIYMIIVSIILQNEK